MQMYSELGLNEEDKAKENRRDETDFGETDLGGRNNIDQSQPTNHGDNSIDQPMEDFLPNEKRVVYDKMNPSMQPGSLFPNMKEF